jgi:hypothetical protein
MAQIIIINKKINFLNAFLWIWREKNESFIAFFTNFLERLSPYSVSFWTMGEDVIDGHVFQCNPSARLYICIWIDCYERLIRSISWSRFHHKTASLPTFDSKATQIMHFVIIESGGSFEDLVTIGLIAMISTNMSHKFVDVLSHLFLYWSHEITICTQINIFAIDYFSWLVVLMPLIHLLSKTFFFTEHNLWKQKEKKLLNIWSFCFVYKIWKRRHLTKTFRNLCTNY